MAVLYVAKSQALGKWGEGVGITKHLYKVGLTEGTADEAVQALNDSKCAGESDWKLVKKEKTDAPDEGPILERLAEKERRIDPNLYPKIKGEPGIFKVKTANVENSIMVKRALEGDATKAVKITPAEIAGYLIQNALK